MIEIQFIDNATLALERVEKYTDDLRPSWNRIVKYMLSAIDMQFVDLSGDLGQGKIARGVKWEYFAPQYTRKDGTVVEAWGGIPRLDGKGMVKGRLRDSTTRRVKKGDSVMQNLGTMRRALLQDNDLSKPLEMTMRVDDNQGKVKGQNYLRPFMFFQDPIDSDVIRDIIEKDIIDVYQSS